MDDFAFRMVRILSQTRRREHDSSSPSSGYTKPSSVEFRPGVCYIQQQFQPSFEGRGSGRRPWRALFDELGPFVPRLGPLVTSWLRPRYPRGIPFCMNAAKLSCWIWWILLGIVLLGMDCVAHAQSAADAGW